MATRRTKREAVAKEMTPEDLEGAVRRSSRNTLAPKRLSYSPESSTLKKKRRTKTHNDINSQNNRKDIKEDADVENSDVEQSGGHGALSEYELKRLETIRQNQAFLSSINLFQAIDELKQSVRPKPSQRGLTRSPAVVKEVLPARKSLRLQNKEAEVLTLPPESKDTLSYEGHFLPKKPPGPLPMDPINMEEGSKLPSQLLELCSEDSKEERKFDLEGYCSALKNMRLTEERVGKVVNKRICSAAFHPCSSSLLMAAGNKWGQVGLWKLDGDWGDDGVLLFEPHSRLVACVAFSRAHPTHLLSLSYDGSLRCMDVEKAVFDDVYDLNELRTFDFMSHDCSTLVVGNSLGDVAIVDRRTSGNSHESLHSLDSKAVRCVHVHPLQKQYFVVAESKVVKIYDSRCLKKTNSKAISQLHGHALSITSAYFSPWTGNRVLTSSLDNHLRVYDTSEMTTKSPLLTSIRHDMQTGRWLTKLSAVWDPKREDCFVVGSMSSPRRVQVFHENGQLQHTFIDPENLNSVLSVTAFHPTRNALLGGNASGRLHIFSD